MGDPRRLRKKYVTPMHPWQKDNIEVERALTTEYALKNKTELWKMNSALRNFKNQAKKLITTRTPQAEKERDQLMQRLQRLGLIQPGAKLDDVLSLSIRDLLERRLQSLVHRKGLARSMKQARQFITHQHVMVADKKITAPGYLVTKGEEDILQFTQRSSLVNPEHPERVTQEEAKPAETAPEEKKEEKAPEKKKVTKKKDAKPKEKKEVKAEAKEEKKEAKEEPKEEKKEEPAEKPVPEVAEEK